jgi:hypothetical protein
VARTKVVVGERRKLAPACESDEAVTMIERRRIRSNDPSEALQLLLEAHREKLDAPTLVVGTPCGRVIAGAGRDVPDLAASIVEQVQGSVNSVATWFLRAGGRELVIASLGKRLSFELAEAVRRICMAFDDKDRPDPFAVSSSA